MACTPAVTFKKIEVNHNITQTNVIAFTKPKCLFIDPSDSQEWITKKRNGEIPILIKTISKPEITSKTHKGPGSYDQEYSVTGHTYSLRFEAEMSYAAWQNLPLSEGLTLWYTYFGELHCVAGIGHLNQEYTRKIGKDRLQVAFEVNWFEPLSSNKKVCYEVPDYFKKK